MNTKHLKAKILDLAIRGKLVEQKAEDGNAFDLLQKIREEKKACHGEALAETSTKKTPHGLDFANAKSRKNKHQNETTLAKVEDAFASDLQCKIPENWCWCRLGEIVDKLIDGNHNPPQGIKEKTNYIMVSSQNINNNELVKLSDVRYLTKEVFELENKRTNATEGDILFTSVGTLGRTCIYQGGYNICFQRSVSVLHTLIFNKYLKYYFDSPYYQQYVFNHATGTAQLGFYLNQMAESVVILPPLPEQKRIVSAIEKAFAQIDIIEKNKLNLKTYIKQTKSKVLDLAIRGKLVEQNAEDGNTFELLEKIRNEKSELIKQKKLKEDKNASFIIKADDDKHYEQFADGSLKDVENEILFEIPKNWCWCKGKSIFLPMTSRTPSGSEFKYIDIETVDNKLQKIHYPKILKTENAPSRASRETLVGDTIFSMVRPYLKNIALITEDLSDCIASTGFFICRPNKALDPKYLYYLMISNYVVNGLNQFMKGDNSPSINGDDITEFYFPLPPLHEQKRIVAKIEQVFEQLDMLEKSLGE